MGTTTVDLGKLAKRTVGKTSLALEELNCLLRPGEAAWGALRYAPTSEYYPTMAYIYVGGRDASGKYSTNCAIFYKEDGTAEISQDSIGDKGGLRERVAWRGKRTDLPPELQRNLTLDDEVTLDDDAESPAGRTAIRNPPPLSPAAVAWLLPHLDRRAPRIPRIA